MLHKFVTYWAKRFILVKGICGFDLFPTWFLLEIPSPEEVDVYRTLQGCLEMRKSYVFKEVVAPWEKEIISDPSTPKRIQNPFDHTPEGKSDVSLVNKLIYQSLLFWPKALPIFLAESLTVLCTMFILMNSIQIFCSTIFRWKTE